MSILSVATHARQVPVDTVDAVLDGQLYLSNLACARTVHEVHPELGITHVLSVCTEVASRGSTRMIISVQDSEYDNILDHLPAACHFIEDALSAGGRVLVHCVMGVSRSATVVAAFLMRKRHLSPSRALDLIRGRRPRIFPNYGFVKQLYVFEACSYEPSRTHPAYRCWKRRQRQDVTQFLNVLSDTTVILSDRIYLNSDLPTDELQMTCLVKYLGLSSCLSLSPSDMQTNILKIDQCHIDVPTDSATVPLALLTACSHIRSVLSTGGRILVYSQTESVAVLAVAAYLIHSRGIAPQQAVQMIGDALPLFEPTSNFMRHLDTFAAYNCSSYPPATEAESAITLPLSSHVFSPTVGFAPLVGAAKDRPVRTVAPPARPVSIVGQS